MEHVLMLSIIVKLEIDIHTLILNIIMRRFLVFCEYRKIFESIHSTVRTEFYSHDPTFVLNYRVV
jgi:hypothetical protein